jgi:hypothetical protein
MASQPPKMKQWTNQNLETWRIGCGKKVRRSKTCCRYRGWLDCLGAAYRFGSFRISERLSKRQGSLATRDRLAICIAV